MKFNGGWLTETGEEEPDITGGFTRMSRVPEWL